MSVGQERSLNGQQAEWEADISTTQVKEIPQCPKISIVSLLRDKQGGHQTLGLSRYVLRLIHPISVEAESENLESHGDWSVFLILAASLKIPSFRLLGTT